MKFSERIKITIQNNDTNKLIDNLTPDQAFEVVQRLCKKQGVVREAVITAAKNVLTEIDMHETAEEVFDTLDSIDVQECWDRAGDSGFGYTTPEDAAMELVEERFEPYFDQVERYHELNMLDQEKTYCMGVILGAYRYEQESGSDFRNWCAEAPFECAGSLLDKWRKRCKDESARNEMNDFIMESCPEWTRYLQGEK